MSYADDLAERRPDLFTETDKKKLASDAEFRKRKASMDRQARDAQDGKQERPVPRIQIPVTGDNQGPVSIPVVNRRYRPHPEP